MRVCIVLVAVLLASAADASTGPPRLPPNVTCEQVRAMVAEHGKALAYAWARLQGYSKREINEAKRCLK